MTISESGADSTKDSARDSACGLQSQRKRIEKLAALILAHKQRYYSGKESIPDEAYDALEDELKSLDPRHPVLSRVGFEPTASNRAAKVAHFPPMLSLAKSYSSNEVGTFISKFEHVCVTDKLDGMALSLEYDENGILVRASTRGNGSLGEDVTGHVYFVPSIPKRIELPKLPYNGHELSSTLEIRGEIFFPLSAFANYSERFESFRNAVPGTFGRKEPADAAEILQEFEFCAYDLIAKSNENTLIDTLVFMDFVGISSQSHFAKLQYIESLGFWSGIKSGQTEKLSAADFQGFTSIQILDSYLKSKLELKRDYAVDGLVIRCDDESVYSRLGNTAHHPRASIAFKQSGETAVTELKEIHIGVGRSGKISFRAELKPVSLSGATIAFATLHNAEFIEAGHYAPGAQVRLKRSGEVIPYIIGVEQAAVQSYILPENCLCGSTLTRQGPDLFCLENPDCPYKDSESLLYFVRALEIYGVSEKLLEKFKVSGLLSSPADLFTLTVEDLLTLDGFGPKLAKNVIDSIAMKRTLPLHTFLTALGLKRGGKVKCFAVAQHFKTLQRVLELSVADLLELNGWAEKSAFDFIHSLQVKKPLVVELLRYLKIVELDSQSESVSLETQNQPKINAENQPKAGIAGKKICITGSLSRSRSEYEEMIRCSGGFVVSAVSAQTDYLVCNEASGSSKYRKAQSLGITILTETDFLALFGDSDGE